jgi:MFS family permease
MTDDVRDAARVDTRTEELPPVSTGFLITYPLAMIGIWMMIMTPAMVTLALKIGEIDPANKETSYGLVAGVGGIVAILANPVFGRFSDRTRSRWGRRKPWIVGGTLGGLLGAALIALAPNIGAVLVGWVVMQLLCNAAIAALVSVLADRVHKNQRGLVGGIIGLTFPAGLLAGTFFAQLTPGNAFVQFLVPALVGLGLVWLFVAVYRDGTAPPQNLPPFSVAEFFGSFYVDPRRNPDLMRMLSAEFLIWVGMAVFQTYMVYFLQDRLHVATADLATISLYSLLVSSLTAIVVAPLTGWFSDRIGRRKPPFVLAAVLIAAGLLVMLLGSLPIFLVGAAITGLGFGMFKGVYLSMSADTLLDTSNAARDLGLVNIAITLPGSLVPLAAPAVLAIGGGGNYDLLFVLGAVAAFASMVPVLRVARVR